MSNPSLLGTPLSARTRERSSAPSPYTPFQPSRGAGTTGERSVTPTSTSRQSTLPQASPTLSTTSTTTTTTLAAGAGSSRTVPSQDELRLQARREVERKRVVADPSLASAFRKDVDRELWELFVGP
ncbi:hypothetical protein JCM11491_006538 [Sporobolomyces phaffii]